MQTRRYEREPVEDVKEYTHVYPLFGPEHVLEGIDCWCHPDVDDAVVIHNVMN